MKDAYFEDKFFVDAIATTGAYGRVQSVDNWEERYHKPSFVRSLFLNGDYSDNNNVDEKEEEL